MAAIHVQRIQERRRAERVEARGNAFVTERRVQSPDPDGDAIPGWDETLAPSFGVLRDLSEGGALLELDGPHALGRRVVVSLELGGPLLEVPGVIVRVQPILRDGVERAIVGVRFRRLPTEALEAIRRYVSAHRARAELN